MSANTVLFEPLKTTSQSTYAILSRFLLVDELAKIEKLYLLSCIHGSLDEGFNRENGVSFNPRPGRIIQLCFDSGNSSYSLAATGIILCTKNLDLMLEEAKSLINFDSIEDLQNSENFSIAQVSIAVDFLRHAHMWKPDLTSILLAINNIDQHLPKLIKTSGKLIAIAQTISNKIKKSYLQ